MIVIKKANPLNEAKCLAVIDCGPCSHLGGCR